MVGYIIILKHGFKKYQTTMYNNASPRHFISHQVKQSNEIKMFGKFTKLTKINVAT